MNSFHILEYFDIYESPLQITIIGSNKEKSIYKIIKFARWTFKEKELYCDDWFLELVEDQFTYTYEQISEVKKCLKSMLSMKLVIENALGIVGFVRFKQGYYMIFITKKSQVAGLGQHEIYKIEETRTFYLPGNTTSPWDQLFKNIDDTYLPQTKHPEEKKYLELFNSVDLSIDNYFSYTYDLSNSVQYNMAYSGLVDKSKRVLFTGIHKQQLLLNDRYVWNWSLWPPSLRPSKERLEASCTWLVALIHGYVGQSNVLASAGCVSLNITLIARRSRHFAGTRFLKRGANQQGNVANEVESEQIIYEEEGINFEDSKVTSLVQLRGSIPLQWQQDAKKVVGKPPIKMTLEDAFYTVSGRHFSTLLYRHGGPIIILNLVKQRERHKFEQPLSLKFVKAIDYLKSSLMDPDLENDILKYIEFDMARIQRGKVKSVLEKLAPIAENCIRKTGFFCSDSLLQQTDCDRVLTKTIQCGLVRTNCIDCLDRTNTAQFVIGQAALCYQLYMLGIINDPKISAVQTLDRMLQALYENHGNVLALQYGGSELVHNVETYRKTAKFSTQSRDFMQTISRYYNNKFSDQVKQMSINIFLGIFKPWQIGYDCIWNHKNSDTYLHDDYCNSQLKMAVPSSTNWLPLDILIMIPKPLVLWHKWRALHNLFAFGDEMELSERYTDYLNDACLSSESNCDFSLKYTHLIDRKNYCLTTINFSRSHVLDVDGRRQSTIYLNGSANWTKFECDSESDPASALSDGIIMAAVRNAKSESSDSSSDSSDEDKHSKSEPFIVENIPVGNHINEQSSKAKFLNFCIRDYRDLSTNIGECVNSSSLLHIANEKFNSYPTQVKKECQFVFDYAQIKVNSDSAKLYNDTVQFNKTGTYVSPNRHFYQQYLDRQDFTARG